jgi:SEC-C motif domain protein
MSVKKCPCGRRNTYPKCCGQKHVDIALALTAEDLMRSRYTAFTKGMGDYLMSSHHSSTRPLERKLEIVSWANSVKWAQLEIITKSEGGFNDKKGTVEFKAHFKEKGKKTFIHENSTFIRENGHWVYLGFED